MREQSLVDVARRRAESQPERRAYTFLADGETDERHLVHADLDRRARAIGARLQAEGGADERVLVCHPPGLEYIEGFFGCLYSGAVAVPVSPPSPGRSLDRLEAIASDARARVGLAPASVVRALEGKLAGRPALAALRWIATDSIPEAEAAGWREARFGPEALAFLQYTSGSTRAPRGVRVSHANLMHNLGLIRDAFGHGPESRGVIWLPPYHDMGLIGGVLQPLFAGFPVVLMSPASFLKRPRRWLQAVSRHRATTSGGPDFAYALCLERVGPDAREGLDLSSWRVAFNGAEPVRARTLEAFAEAFAGCGFRRRALYPCYGLAEATLWVSGRCLEDVSTPGGAADVAGAVSCGRPGAGQRIVIADPRTFRRVPEGEQGEIWVSGPSVADGYWDLPEETEAVFRARLADTGEGPFLRTGDLGRLAGGELHVTGRLKDLVIIDGVNHHAEDLEWTAERSHPSLGRQAAAFPIEEHGAERLAIVHELATHARDLDLDAVVGAIRRAVAAEHAVPVHAVALLRPGGLPRTSSGKVRRSACRELFLAGRLPALREWRLSAAGGRSSGAPA